MENIVKFETDLHPEAAMSGAVLVQTGDSVFLTFNAMGETGQPHPSGGHYGESGGTAIVELVNCIVTKFGYPNNEARWAIPRYRDIGGYGIYRVENSLWLEELVKANRHALPNAGDWNSQHFLFLFHESSFECIADDIFLELSRESYRAIWDRLGQKVVKG